LLKKFVSGKGGRERGREQFRALQALEDIKIKVIDYDDNVYVDRNTQKNRKLSFMCEI
jgi:hypothetical protein